jgi:glutamate-1-semialdehyde 2,1-aminomutase
MSDIERARRVMPGGVSSPVRAFTGVGGEPVFIRAARGAYLETEKGDQLIDLIGGYGPHILGHGHPAIVAAVREAAGRGTAFGAPTTAEVTLAEWILNGLGDGHDMVRLVNSGTEATMSALRLARAATGRDRFLKFIGCYHGHGDAFLVAAGSGAATLGVPSSPGVPGSVTRDTLLAPYNDLDATRAVFAEHGESIAAIFVEPIAGNMGLVPPVPGFLEGLRKLCDDHGALLVFDEVMTGFRVDWTSAQGILGVRPDLTTLGKVIGGGLPLAAYAGPARLMEMVAPAGPVYQAGTLSGNPVAVAAGTAALEQLATDDHAAYRLLEAIGGALEEGLSEIAFRYGTPLRVQRQGSMVGVFFTDSPVTSIADVDASDRRLFTGLFHAMLERGVHLPPSPYETFFLSTAHGDEEIERVLEAFDASLEQVLAGRTS